MKEWNYLFPSNLESCSSFIFPLALYSITKSWWPYPFNSSWICPPLPFCLPCPLWRLAHHFLLNLFASLLTGLLLSVSYLSKPCHGLARGISLQCKPHPDTPASALALACCVLRIKSKAYKFQVETYEPLYDLLPLIPQLTIPHKNLKDLEFPWDLKKGRARTSLSFFLLSRINLSPSSVWLSVLLQVLV